MDFRATSRQVNRSLPPDQRLAVRIARGGLGNHRPDVCWPLLEGNDTIAETGLPPHFGNWILRPVHSAVFLS
jgi:hypothetical protein